jgi:biotin carboxylase
VIEVAARLGGGHDAELCTAATGVDLNALALQAALGESPSHLLSAARGLSPGGGLTPALPTTRQASRGTGPSGASPPGQRGAAVVFLVPPPGGLVEVEGVAEAEALPGVYWVRVYHRPGHVFGPLRRGADRAGAVLATGADREEALERGRRTADAVRFRVDADAS